MSACDTFQVQLSQFLDGELAAAEHAAVAGHLKTCAVCQGVARDLERVRAAARQLGPIDPPDHVWLEVAGQIRFNGPAPTPLISRPSRSRPSLWHFAVLAAALVLVTLGLYVVGLVRPPAEQQTSASVPVTTRAAVDSRNSISSIDSINDELTQALGHYDKAIAQLQSLASTNQNTIDATTAAMLQKNIAMIDQAIAESRAALTSDPDSEAARLTLMEALRQKVSVLQVTVSLMQDVGKDGEAPPTKARAGMGSS